MAQSYQGLTVMDLSIHYHKHATTAQKWHYHLRAGQASANGQRPHAAITGPQNISHPLLEEIGQQQRRFSGRTGWGAAWAEGGSVVGSGGSRKQPCMPISYPPCHFPGQTQQNNAVKPHEIQGAW